MTLRRCLVVKSMTLRSVRGAPEELLRAVRELFECIADAVPPCSWRSVHLIDDLFELLIGEASHSCSSRVMMGISRHDYNSIISHSKHKSNPLICRNGERIALYCGRKFILRWTHQCHLVGAGHQFRLGSCDR